MHIPDGFIDAGASAAAGLVAAGGLGVALKKTSRRVDDKQVPLAGLTAAFVFAAQMLNFPVAAGTSGHLVGGALAAILIGPWAGALCIAVVVIVQALFADGGVTALGLNLVNLSLVTALGGYALFTLARWVLPKSSVAVVVAAGVAAGLSVLLAALSFWIEFAIGGAVDLPPAGVLGAMAGVHALIGVGEGLITALTVGLILSVRPDLVYGARDLTVPLEVRTQAPTAGGAS